MSHNRSDDGVELSDGGMIEWPDDDGTIRRRDVHGNCEEIRRIGDDDYEEWRDLFPDDAVYFQPEDYEPSYVVWRNFDKCEEANPDADILTFTGDDIQCPKFADVEHPNNIEE